MERIKLTQSNQDDVIRKAMAVLKNGGLVIYPTETCYGIGADATNQIAINALLKYKTNRQDKAISVAVTGKQMAAKYVHINKVAANMYGNFLPGPITVISRGKGKLAKGVESSRGTQGIRVSSHPFVLDLVKQYKKPITATSANASYKKTPYTIADILSNLTDKQKNLIGLIVDAGRLPKRKPSTVVDTTLDNIHILREGSMELDDPNVFRAESLHDTERFVGELHDRLKQYWGKKAVVFLLQGDLGAGKTHFTKYLAKKLGVTDMVTSPTFTLCNEHKGKVGRTSIKFFHTDTYRMYDQEELEYLKPLEIFKSPNVVVIEWANKIYSHVRKYLGKAIVIEVLIDAPQESVRVFRYKVNA